jgi:hypothetical protein
MKVERCEARVSTTPLRTFAPVDNLTNVEYSPVGQDTFCLRVNVSMISLKWGDFLSMLLPGTVALFALSSWIPTLNDQMKHFQNVGAAEGFALLIAAALLGGVLEAITRVTWEKYWLVKRCPLPRILSRLTSGNLELYERGVQGSYKWATFYANLSWATIVLLVGLWHGGSSICSLSTSVLVALTALLLRASHVQWTYYVNYQTEVFGGQKNAE